MSSFLSDFGRLVRVGLALGFPAVISSQGALVTTGSEALLSGASAGNQVYPGLSLGEAGGYVVWQDNNVSGGSGWDIQARRLDAQGAGLGVPFRVNAVAANNQERPQVAVLNDGGAAFVWQGGPVGFQTVQARFMSRDGSFLSSTDLVVSPSILSRTTRASSLVKAIRNNRPTVRRFLYTKMSAQRRDFVANPAVTALADGTVVVAYATYQRLTTNTSTLLPMVKMYGAQALTNSVLVPQELVSDFMLDVFLRRYTPGGLLVGDEVHVNQESKFNQRNAAVAPLASGFVVVWVSENQGVSDSDLALGLVRQDIYARVFDSQGLALTDEFRVNDLDRRDNTFPSVVGLPEGGFRVAWSQNGATRAAGLDIVTRAFGLLGGSPSAIVRVNEYLPGDQYAPKLAACPAGQMVIWTSINQDGSNEGVFGRWLAPDGSLAGSEFRVNTSTAGRQYQQAVGANSGNSVVTAWAGLRQGSGFDVFSQRYSASNP
jgi:hypothetical protein